MLMDRQYGNISGRISARGSIGGGMVSGRELSGTVDKPTAVQIKEIISNTTEYWSTHPTLTKKDVMYVYTDYDVDEEGRDVPGIKIGSGNAYLADLAFVMRDYRITNDDIAYWNNKVSARVLSGEEVETLELYI